MVMWHAQDRLLKEPSGRAHDGLHFTPTETSRTWRVAHVVANELRWTDLTDDPARWVVTRLDLCKLTLPMCWNSVCSSAFARACWSLAPSFSCDDAQVVAQSKGQTAKVPAKVTVSPTPWTFFSGSSVVLFRDFSFPFVKDASSCWTQIGSTRKILHTRTHCWRLEEFDRRNCQEQF